VAVECPKNFAERRLFLPESNAHLVEKVGVAQRVSVSVYRLTRTRVEM
jgi:hypothetical protein